MNLLTRRRKKRNYSGRSKDFPRDLLKDSFYGKENHVSWVYISMHIPLKL